MATSLPITMPKIAFTHADTNRTPSMTRNFYTETKKNDISHSNNIIYVVYKEDT